MKLIYDSGKIEAPDINLINHLRETILDLEKTEDTKKYIIKMSEPLYSILDSEMYPPYHLRLFRGIEYIWDMNIEDGCYCIYKKDKAIPIKLTSVKTLDEWFANLPLIYKLDLYNSYTSVITRHLK